MTSRMVRRPAQQFHVDLPPRSMTREVKVWIHQGPEPKSHTFAATEVIKNLYLGGESDLIVDELRSRNIHYVLNLAEECSPLEAEGILTKKFALRDHSDENIALHLEDALRFIDDALATGSGIIVHCKLGISRSSTVVIGYLMKHGDRESRQHMSYEEAFDFVKHQRPHISPNLGFILALHDFNARLEAARPLLLANGAVVVASPGNVPRDYHLALALTTSGTLPEDLHCETRAVEVDVLTSLDRLDDVFEEVEDHLRNFNTTGRRVLIVCPPGISWNAALLIAFLLRFGEHGAGSMSLSDAFSFAAKSRSCKPNIDWARRVSNPGLYRTQEVF